MMVENNSDLCWGMNHITQRKKAYEYISQFRDVFCIYSESVCQLYSNYRLQYDDDLGSREIQIHPDENAWHHTFSHVSPQAVRPSNILLFPGELFGRDGFYVRLPVKGSDKKPVLSLRKAFEKVFSKNDNFLPLIRKGDLREFKTRSPYLHLHWLDLDQLDQLSSFQRLDIAETITSRFHDMVMREELV